eukprot:gene9099-10071_t
MLPLIVIFIPVLVIWFVRHTFWKCNKTYDVREKVVLITGASSGLGEACAWKFAKAGAKVILCARNMDRLQRIRNEIIKQVDQVEDPKLLYLDLNVESNISKMMEEALKLYGCIDILINNAGISFRGAVQDTTIDVHRNLMNVNYFGAVVLTRAVLPSMVNRKAGHIVTVSSVQGKIAIPYRSAYAASKHACEAFFNCLRSEIADSNIFVTVVSPGYIHTNLSLNAVTSDGTSYGVLDSTTANGMHPTYVAGQIVDAVETRQEQVILADFKSNIAIILNCIWSSLFYKIMKKRAKNEKDTLWCVEEIVELENAMA